MQLRRFHATATALALVAFGAVGAGTALAANAGHGAAARHQQKADRSVADQQPERREPRPGSAPATR